MVLFLDSLVRFPVPFGTMPVLPWRDQDLILVPALALYTTQKQRGCSLSLESEEISQKQYRKMVNPLFPVQMDCKTNPAYRDHFRSKRSQDSVCRLRQRDTLASLPLQACNCCIPQRNHQRNNPGGCGGQFQLLCRFLPSAVSPSRNRSALISSAPWGQEQVWQYDARVPVLPTLPGHFVFTHGQSFQGTILKTVQHVEILCQIPQDMLNKTQYWRKSSVKSTWLHFMGLALNCAYLQEIFKFTTFTDSEGGKWSIFYYLLTVLHSHHSG